MYLGLAGGFVAGLQVGEGLQHQQSVGIVGEPSLAVGIHLAVLGSLVWGVPHGIVGFLETEQTGGPHAVARGLEEDDAVGVGHSRDFPWSHLAGLAAFVLDGVSHHKAAASLIHAELFADAQS